MEASFKKKSTSKKGTFFRIKSCLSTDHFPKNQKPNFVWKKTKTKTFLKHVRNQRTTEKVATKRIKGGLSSSEG